MPESPVNTTKWVAYDVARSRLLMRLNEVINAIHQEEAKTFPDQSVIVALDNELDALNTLSDLLSADDVELTRKIASPDWKGLLI